MATDFAFFADGSQEGNSFAFANEPAGGPGGSLDYDWGMVAYGSNSGVVGCGGKPMTRLLGPYSTFAGVHGTARDFTGVAGTSVNHVGVYGQVGDAVAPPGLHAGVPGTGRSQRAVIGISEQGGGVEGYSFGAAAVFGRSALSQGVQGNSSEGAGGEFFSEGNNGVVGVSGPSSGPFVPNTSNIAGVVGSSDRQHGVIGTSNASVGVIGFSHNIGVLGYVTAPGAIAGQFIGDLQVTGTKAAVVPFPDGTHRALYCMESPELWFEDFGAARLRRGRTVVKLDENFAKVIKRGDYKVFLTPEDDCRGLYVRRKSAVSFEVREFMGGKSNVAFSYRIVGRRKDIRGHRRFAKFDKPMPPPAPRVRRPAPTRAAFIADLERRARATATPAMRKSDREVAAMPPAILIPGRHRAPAR